MDTSPEETTPIQAESRDDTVTFKRSHLYAVLLPLAFVAGLSLGYVFWGRSVQSQTDSANAPRASAQNQPAAPDQAPSGNPTRYDVPTDDDPSLGPADAPITMIEFSDYECPYCRKWHNEVFKPLMSNYAGKIRFVYRDFPLSSSHFNAQPAAEAANCAGEQNQYWEFADKMFASESGLGSEMYLQSAKELGLDLEKFSECVSSRRYEDEVTADYEYAANLGIRSTPTFFINGLALIGAQPYEVFQTVIDQELAGEIP